MNFNMKLCSIFIAACSLLLAVGCSRSETQEVAVTVEPSSSPTVPAKEAAQVADTSSLPRLGQAPDWEVKRLDGSIMSSAELAGKVGVLDFWATWCPPCKEEIPGYIEMQRELEAKGVVIVGVSLDRGGPSVVEKFGQQYQINYPLVMGDEQIVNAFGGIEAIPTTFLIDRSGQVRHRKVGMMERSEYEPLIRSLL